MMTIEDVLRTNLTEAQVAAAEDRAHEVLALACAGSGKTRTLAFRTARLIAEGQRPDGIVAFTFTEKAADAIRLRVAEALLVAGLDPLSVGAMFVGTIHSYCQRLLGHTDARYRQFDVLDENRLRLYLMSRYPQLELHRLRAARGARYFQTVDEVAVAWSIFNDEGLELADVERDDPLLAQVLANLRLRMEQDQFIDFSSILRRTVDSLGGANAAASHAIAAVRHLMVDEYQDVNPIQERLIRLLHPRLDSLFAVGDDDQAIYAWRGADVGNILTFTDRYPHASVHNLVHNFRSTRAIVGAAEAFAAAELGATRIRKDPEAEDPAGPRDLRKLWFPTRPDEAAWVAETISGMLGTAFQEADGTVRGLTPGDFAVLMRSTRLEENTGAPRHAAFTSALRDRGITYSLEAGGGIFDRPQAAVLRDTFELLRDGSPSRETARAHFDTNVVPVYPDADFGRMALVLSEWGRLVHTPAGGGRRRVYPQQLVHDLLSAFGIQRSRFDAGIMQDLGIFSRILQDVESVYMSIDSSQRFADVLNFLRHPAETGYDTSTEDVLRRPDAVTVSTVHKVKGLEFPVVFIVDVEAQRFPRNRAGYRGWLPIAAIGPALARGAFQSTPAEEARLMYTALTRAERFLYVSGAENLPAGARTRGPSRFAVRLDHAELGQSPAGLAPGLAPCAPRRRVDETVVPTTYSEIRYYLRCPRDYQFRKSFGFSPPITDLFGFGRSVHATVGKLHEQFGNRAPTAAQAEELARWMFHVKHVPPSKDPSGSPGPYERARDAAARILQDYARDYSDDFTRRRQVEVPFEVPVANAVISGTIDLLLKVDEEGNILDASVIDFKAIEGGEDPVDQAGLDWTELALQVQLYAKAAREVLGEAARTGHVHLLKDNQRVEVPVDPDAVAAAVANVEWAVDRVLAEDFPMRPSKGKCGQCDFRLLCPQTPENFRAGGTPPAIRIPGGSGRLPRVFSDLDGA